MKQTFLLLAFLFHFILSAQTDTNISVISIEKTGVVYRGVNNPIKIAVPGAKSYKINSNGSLEKLDSIGNYNLNITGTAGRKAKIIIDITMPDNSTKQELKEYDIEEIPHRTAYIKSNYSSKVYEMTLEDLKSLKLESLIENLSFRIDTSYNKIMSFVMQIEGHEDIRIKGDRMTVKAFAQIKDLPIGVEIFITEISTYNPHQYYLRAIPPIKIRIVDNSNQSIKPIVITNYSNNILYRGIDNPLRIEVPEGKSFQVKGPGLSLMAEDSTYTINVSHIKEDRVYLDFIITIRKDSIIQAQEVFYVKDIIPKKITINDKSCKDCILKMTLAELKNALIDIKVDDASESLANDEVLDFVIKIPDADLIEINGNRITDETLKRLSTLRKKTIIEIQVPSYFGFPFDTQPLKIMITEKD